MNELPPRPELDRHTPDDWLFQATIFRGESSVGGKGLAEAFHKKLQGRGFGVTTNPDNANYEIYFACDDMTAHDAVGFAVARLCDVNDLAGIDSFYVIEARLIRDADLMIWSINTKMPGFDGPADMTPEIASPPPALDVTLTAIDFEREIAAARQIDTSIFFREE